MMKKVVALILAVSVFISCSVGIATLPCLAVTPNEIKFNCGTWCNKTDLEMTQVEKFKRDLEHLKFQKVLGETDVSAKPTNGNSVNPYFIMFAIQAAIPVISWVIKSIYLAFSSWSESHKNCGNILEITDPIETLQKLDVCLRVLKGQEKAKKQIRSIILNIITQKKQKLSSDKKGATVIYMVGPSGVGKSYSASILTKILTGEKSKPYIVEASDIDKQSKASPVEQLFGMRTLHVGPWETYEISPLLKQIKSTPNMVILINEYDKMHSPEMDEKLRTLMDQAYIKVNGETIDGSGLTVIVTSNESSNSVHNGNQDTQNVDDGTGSRTFIKHDTAFLNRIKLIEFENLDVEEYKEIAILPCKELMVRFFKEYRILLKLEAVPKIIAEKATKLNKGARPIYTYIEELNTKILNDVILPKVQDKSYLGKSFTVSYDDAKEEFTLREENLQGPLELPEKQKTVVEEKAISAEQTDTTKSPEDKLLLVS